MEARASFSGASVPKTFVAAVLVIVAMGLAAMGGYAARGLTAGSAVTSTAQGIVHPAAGTVLRQDNPVQAPAELPGWVQREIAPRPAGRIIVDDPNFIRQYLATPSSAHLAGRSTGFQEIP